MYIMVISRIKTIALFTVCMIGTTHNGVIQGAAKTRIAILPLDTSDSSTDTGSYAVTLRFKDTAHREKFEKAITQESKDFSTYVWKEISKKGDREATYRVDVDGEYNDATVRMHIKELDPTIVITSIVSN